MTKGMDYYTFAIFQFITKLVLFATMALILATIIRYALILKELSLQNDCLLFT